MINQIYAKHKGIVVDGLLKKKHTRKHTQSHEEERKEKEEEHPTRRVFPSLNSYLIKQKGSSKKQLPAPRTTNLFHRFKPDFLRGGFFRRRIAREGARTREGVKGW